METKMADGKEERKNILDMVMCGDHQSVTKAELNANVSDVKVRDKEKSKIHLSFPKVSPTTSRTEQPERTRGIESEQPLRLYDAKRRAKPLEVRADALELRAEVANPTNQVLIQTIMGSIHWPPYLVVLWVVALVFTHLLHCVVNLLEKTLPNLRGFCHYFRTWTESAWHSNSEHRAYSLAIASVTGVLYALYCSLFILYSLLLWAMEPLCSEGDVEEESKVTNYEDVKI